MGATNSTSDTLVMDLYGTMSATNVIGEEGLGTFEGSDGVLNHGRTASGVKDAHAAGSPAPMVDIRVAAPKGQGPSVKPPVSMTLALK